jgi:hypothetical protein
MNQKSSDAVPPSALSTRRAEDVALWGSLGFLAGAVAVIIVGASGGALPPAETAPAAPLPVQETVVKCRPL